VKILHIIPRFIGGGPERHLLALAAAWRDAGWETRHRVAVLDPPISAPLLIKARRLGFAVTAPPGDDALDEAIADADVVEVTYWNHPRMLDLLRRELPAARLLVRSAVAGITPPQVLPSELGRFADAMIITSPASLETPALRYVARAGMPFEFIPALADMSRLAGFVPRPHEGVRVGYLGLVEPTKMHPRFAELTAAVRNRDVAFDVFGDGSWEPEVQRRLGELGAAGRVHFHGHVEDLRRAFAEIDILGYPLAPDTYVTSDKVIQEAMWAGIPPVVLAGTGASGLVQHELTGLVCETENDYPRAIERLASDVGLRRRLGDAARDVARRHFDPVRNSMRFRTVFDAVAALPRRTRDPLPGRGDSAARRFVIGLGEMGGPFAVSMQGAPGYSSRDVAQADTFIAQASEVLARSDGGLIHYRNMFPDDGFLRLWSGLVAAHAGDEAMAAREFDAAGQLGVPLERVADAIGVVPGYRHEVEGGPSFVEEKDDHHA
jgi:glycosyltransferase involved in cell wall biosynthesis